MGKSVDTKGSESAYLQGANELSRAAQLGALFFAQDTATANRIISDASISSQQSLQPLTNTAGVAITELRRLMGLVPEDPLLKIQNTIQSVSSHYQSRGDIPVSYRNQMVSLQASFDKMHNAKTQSEREAYKTELMGNLDKAINTFSGVVPISSEWVASGRAGGLTSQQAGGTGITMKDLTAATSGGNVKGEATGGAYAPGYFSMNVGQLQTARDQLKDFSMTEESVHPKAMTGDQIAQEMMAKPSYQFMFQAGTKAAERGAAAQGTRFSGNQMVSLQQLGQNLAQQEYNNEITRLMSLAGMTTPGITQTAGTQFNTGQIQTGNMMQQAASGQLAQNLIGQGYQNAYNKIGDARMQAQIANAQMGMQAAQMGMGLLGKLF